MKKGLNILDINDFENSFRAGNLYKRFSANGRFCIFNYTQETNIKKNWTKVTKQARGLIFDVATGKVVARPMCKFFNMGETRATNLQELVKIQPFGFEATEKIDGSLGIVYFDYYDKKLCVATRGSFDGEQAIWATKFLNESMPDSVRAGLKKLIDERKTPCVEIVYPENHIVVSYGDRKDLVLIQIVNNDTGETSEYKDVVAYANLIGMNSIKIYDDFYVLDQLIYECKNNIIGTEHEGFVVRFKKNGLMTKIKSEDYKFIAKSLAHFGPKAIYEAAVKGQSIEQYFVDASLPEELLPAAKEQYNVYISEFEKRKIELLKSFDSVPIHLETRKDVALYFKSIGKSDIIGLYFAIKDGKFNAVDEYVWKNIDYRDYLTGAV